MARTKLAVHHLVVTIQLKADDAFAPAFDIEATVGSNERYTASGSLDDPARILRIVATQIARRYPRSRFFELFGDDATHQLVE